MVRTQSEIDSTFCTCVSQADHCIIITLMTWIQFNQACFEIQNDRNNVQMTKENETSKEYNRILGSFTVFVISPIGELSTGNIA